MFYQEEVRSVSCSDSTLQYKLIRKPVKNVNLRIKSDGTIFVSANNQVPVEFIDSFVVSREVQINRSLKKFADYRKYIAQPKQYVSGESFYLLGKNLQLKVIEDNMEKVISDGIHIFLYVKEKANFLRKETLLNDWLRDIQEQTFREICDKTYPIFKKYGIGYPEIKVRFMTSRWGSCRPTKGRITLNSRLIAAPRHCIEYVILHEFTHFLYPNHSKGFYSFVAIQMPDWRVRKQELEKWL